MNLFVKLILCALAIAIAGPFFIKGPDGKPLLDIGELSPGISGSIDEGLSSLKSGAKQLKPGQSKIYKWKDENGVWQMSDAPPMEALLEAESERRKAQALDALGSPNLATGETADVNQQSVESRVSTYNVEEVYVDANANVIQSLSNDQINKALGRTPKNGPKNGAEDGVIKWNNEKDDEPEDLTDGLSLTSVPLEKVPQLMDNAKAAKKIIEQRADKINQMLQQN